MGKVAPVRLDNLIDFYKNTFYEKGERHRPGHVIPSAGVNTLGEVPDSSWYTNRQRKGRMTLDQLVTGPNRTGPPSKGDRWTVVSAKAEGVTPGFTIKDTAGRRYLLKFDPPSNLELATGADAVSARFFYALGYNVPENYAIRFRREQLAVGENVKFTDRWGQIRPLSQHDIDEMLRAVRPYPDGSYRALASLYLAGEPVGPYKYYGRRADDPNELAPHEHLRVLRGLYVFAAWLNHTDAKSLNSLDMVVEERGRRFIRHHLIDFGATLGSDSLYAKDPRLGHEYFLAAAPGLLQFVSLGLYVPDYARIDFPNDRAVGNFSAQAFDPDEWKSNYPNAAFENRLPGDEYWAAKQVMAFTDTEMRAMVQAGEYTHPETAAQIASILSARRLAIGRTFLAKVLPLEEFRITPDNRLVFEDLEVAYGLRSPAKFEFAWRPYVNSPDAARQPVAGTGDVLPAAAQAAADGAYWAVDIRDPSRPHALTLYLRRAGRGWQVAGIDREGATAWRPH